ncbi:pilus assembly protein TadG-related protein [Thermopolyspora sp. NPDC052614]|uniref:pilus assembly protein TadG-related protein n=1 Tax=Thermopolyspora sp. NPDC052614 TaxID=3155682 RepID=UPI003415E67A
MIAPPETGRHPGERGSLAVFVVLFSVAVLVLAGLLVDGGAQINARLRAGDIAEQAARAAADAIDVERLRATGEVRIAGGSQACGRAREVVRNHREAGAALTRCTVAGGAQRVTTQVRIEWRAFFLTIIGFTGGTMTAEASAGPRTR